jgi:hypothetical protein
MSEIRTDTINNASGDNDSGIDLSTNDQIILKTADTTALTISSSQVATFANPPIGAGNLIRLSQTSVTSSVSSVDFGSSLVDVTKYQIFYLTIDGASSSTNGNLDLHLKFSSDNNSSFMTTIAFVEYNQINGTDSGKYRSRGTFNITEDEENTTTDATCGQVWIFNPARETSNGTASNMYVFGMGSALNDNGSSYYTYTTRAIVGSGSNPLNGLRFASNANFTQGIFTLYGIPK